MVNVLPSEARSNSVLARFYSLVFCKPFNGSSVKLRFYIKASRIIQLDRLLNTSFNHLSNY